MANQFIARKGLIALEDSQITGSLSISSSLTASGLNYPSADGTDGQVIITDGAGNLSFSGVSADDAEAIHIPVKNTSGVTITKGTPVYITGNVGGSERLEIAAADASDSAKMPAVGLLESDLDNNDEGFVAQGGYLRGLDTDPIDGVSTDSNDTIYVKAGGGLTVTKPTGSALIQNIAKVARSHGSAGSVIVSSILRTNDVPNLPTGKIWVGSDTYTVTSSVLSINESTTTVDIDGTLSIPGFSDVSASLAEANITAGAGLAKTGNTLKADFDNGGIITDAGAFSTSNTSNTQDKFLVYHDDEGSAQKASFNDLQTAYDIVDVTGVPSNNQIAIFTDSNTIEGTSELTYDGTTLNVDGKIDIDADVDNGAVVDIVNTRNNTLIGDSYALKVEGADTLYTGGVARRAFAGYFLAGTTTNVPAYHDTIALYAQAKGYNDQGGPFSYAAIFSGSNGVVGINTMEPEVELDVVGDISASNNIVAGNDISIAGFPSVSASLAAIKPRFAVNGACFLSQTAQRAMPFGSSTGESTVFSYITTYMIPADCKLLRVNTVSQANGGDVTLKAYKIPDNTADNTAISNGTLLQTVTVQDHDAGDPFEFTFGSTGTITKGSKFGLTVESDTNPNGFRFTAYFEEV